MHLLLGADVYGHLHAHWKKYGGRHDYKWLYYVEVLHVDILA